MKPTVVQIEEYLAAVDSMFPVPLSEKQNLTEFAQKLYEKATLCTVLKDGKIVAMLAGYTEALENGMAYISIVATRKEAQGKGYAATLLKEFLEICKKKNIKAVHLYAVRENLPAVQLYKRFGFREWKPENEVRPEDLHLIYYMDEER